MNNPPATVITITGRPHAGLLKCWSADNGVDQFGRWDLDCEMQKARRRHGEVLCALPCQPRLILFREQKRYALCASIWLTMSLTEYNAVPLLAALSAACCKNDDERLHVDVISWTPDDHDVSISVNGLVSDLTGLRALYRRTLNSIYRKYIITP